MKQMTCEMCGSTEIVKQDGVFVCQTCGCRYSVEEARKMMIEGIVDVKGTVEVDNSAYVKKYLENARRAKEKEDWEETEKYYNLVEQNDPHNIEAVFYSAYGKAKTTLISDDIYKRQAAFKVLENCISIIDDNFDVSREDENEKAIVSMAADLAKMICSNFVFTKWEDAYGSVTTNKQETYGLFSRLITQFYQSINNIAKIADAVYLHNALIFLFETAIGTGNYNTVTLDSLLRAEYAIVDSFREKEIEKYWEEHKEEKTRLDNEAQLLLNQIDALTSNIDNLPEVHAVKKLEEQIASLQEEIEKLGLFKRKERKELKEQLKSLTLRLSSANDAKEKVIAFNQAEIEKKQSRVEEIYKELTTVH